MADNNGLKDNDADVLMESRLSENNDEFMEDDTYHLSRKPAQHSRGSRSQGNGSLVGLCGWQSSSRPNSSLQPTIPVVDKLRHVLIDNAMDNLKFEVGTNFHPKCKELASSVGKKYKIKVKETSRSRVLQSYRGDSNKESLNSSLNRGMQDENININTGKISPVPSLPENKRNIDSINNTYLKELSRTTRNSFTKHLKKTYSGHNIFIKHKTTDEGAEPGPSSNRNNPLLSKPSQRLMQVPVRFHQKSNTLQISNSIGKIDNQSISTCLHPELLSIDNSKKKRLAVQYTRILSRKPQSKANGLQNAVPAQSTSQHQGRVALLKELVKSQFVAIDNSFASKVDSKVLKQTIAINLRPDNEFSTLMHKINNIYKTVGNSTGMVPGLHAIKGSNLLSSQVYKPLGGQVIIPFPTNTSIKYQR